MLDLKSYILMSQSLTYLVNLNQSLTYLVNLNQSLTYLVKAVLTKL